MPSIKNIKIRTFRGIPELEIQLNGKSLVLQGHNGTGKTSLIQAFEYFFLGKISDFIGVQELSFNEHAPHVSGSLEELSVEITFNPGEIVAGRTPDTPPSIPPTLEGLFQSAQSYRFILRRMDLLEFINATPGNRFRAIGRLLGTGDLDEKELGLKRVKEACSSELEKIDEQISNSKNAINNELDSSINEPFLVLANLNEKLSSNDLDELEFFEEENLKEYKKYIQSKIQRGSGAEKLQYLKGLQNKIGSNYLPADFLEKINGFNDQVSDLIVYGKLKTRKVAI